MAARVPADVHTVLGLVGKAVFCLVTVRPYGDIAAQGERDMSPAGVALTMQGMVVVGQAGALPEEKSATPIPNFTLTELLNQAEEERDVSPHLNKKARK